MLEILQYVTSSIWVFLGSITFVCGGFMSIGWAFNAAFLGLKGIKADRVFQSTD